MKVIEHASIILQTNLFHFRSTFDKPQLENFFGKKTRKNASTHENTWKIKILFHCMLLKTNMDHDIWGWLVRPNKRTLRACVGMKAATEKANRAQCWDMHPVALLLHLLPQIMANHAMKTLAAPKVTHNYIVQPFEIDPTSLLCKMIWTHWPSTPDSHLYPSLTI